MRWIAEREDYLILYPDAPEHEKVRRDLVDLRELLDRKQWPGLTSFRFSVQLSGRGC